ncbi:MAG: metal-binding protein [Chloroflexi bacterium RBG_13_50_21]|nr:MAG: metal-binding protein [Chloroflexi bacterium RBG_13_50_21]OGO60928.1 MAG: metal-binding protein [Chloroflexi bacterium RBG_19FT_COMBO_47_9]
MADKDQVESILRQQGYHDYKWLDPWEIVVAEWVRMKCEFGCPSYGKVASCPPNNPSVEECRRFFSEYKRALVLHFQMIAPEKAERKTWSARTNLKLIKLEREVFLAGFHKAFLLIMDSCELCAECVPDRVRCKEPRLSRPSPEGMSVDVFTTVRKVGYPIEVLTDPNQTMNRYAFLMVE